ncbi:MAG: GNAT family N-acetyltransferase [Candidatus Izemoplasmatales bacterium]|nr:GNAT family N-acetyltransferase [Candidatus Izemoplasmatales bacterium]MDD3865812.1 GNAT family N-acetyltransferase [Candidatus Izemoplasmatales bacterium]
MIKEISTDQEKTEICERILKALPTWFGLPESTREYIENSKQYLMFAALDANEVVGFISLRPTTQQAMEVYVMGIMPKYHRQGIGKQLIEKAEEYIRTRKYRFLHVKTVSPEAKYESYLKTYAFYKAMGFNDLEVLPLWDEGNPCLLMVKAINE